MKPTLLVVLITISFGLALLAGSRAAQGASNSFKAKVAVQEPPPTFTPVATAVPRHFSEGVATSPVTTIAPAVATYRARAEVPEPTVAPVVSEVAPAPRSTVPILIGALAIMALIVVAAIGFVMSGALRED